MKRAAAILLALVLTGCATSAVVYLQNMRGDMVRCGPYPNAASTATESSDAAARRELNTCVADYESKGYRAVPGPRFIPEIPPGF